MQVLMTFVGGCVLAAAVIWGVRAIYLDWKKEKNHE